MQQLIADLQMHLAHALESAECISQAYRANGNDSLEVIDYGNALRGQLAKANEAFKVLESSGLFETSILD